MKSNKDYLIYCSTFFSSNTHVTVVFHSQKFSVLVKVLILDKELSFTNVNK